MLADEVYDKDHVIDLERQLAEADERTKKLMGWLRRWVRYGSPRRYTPTPPPDDLDLQRQIIELTDLRSERDPNVDPDLQRLLDEEAEIERDLLVIKHQPRRGSDVEAYIKARRDESGHPASAALDWLLDDYRLRADEGRPLLDELVSIPAGLAFTAKTLARDLADRMSISLDEAAQLIVRTITGKDVDDR